MIEIFQINTGAFVLLAGLLGLLVGSFLNVVIYRLPLMMNRVWRSQCAALLKVPGEPAQPRFNLIGPSSRCPKCGHAIPAWENIPVISYLMLRGKCSACSVRISWRYPAVEILTALLSAAVAWHFGFGWTAAAALLLTWALVALSFIDVDHQLLPDSITLPLLWAGLALSLVTIDGTTLFANNHDAIVGALAGYLSLWSVYWLFKLCTGKEGMGHGDFKLLALFGAWLGWQAVPVIILLASLVGAVLGIALILLRGRDKNLPIPFGPYLAIAGWIALLWDEDIIRAYWTFTGLS